MRPGDRASRSSRVTGSSGKTQHQGPARPGPRHRRADRRAGRLAQRRGRRAADGLPGDLRHPVPRRRDGGPGDRPRRVPHDDRAAGRRRRPQRRRRARRRVRLARGGRAGQGRARRGAAPQTGSPSSTPTTPTCARWRSRTARTRRHRRGRRSDADVRAVDVRLDAARPRDVHRRGDDRAAQRRDLGSPAAHHVGNALAVRRRRRSSCGMTLDAVVQPHCQTARPASRWRMEVHERADGVTVVNDAYNANPDSMRAALDGPARDRPGPGAPRTWAVLGEMLELGDRVARRARRAVGALGGRTSATDRLVVVGAGATLASPTAPRRCARAATEVDAGSPNADAAYDAPAVGAVARRRGAAQVQPRRGPALARRPTGRDRGRRRVKGCPHRRQRCRSSSRPCSAPRCSSGSSSSRATDSSSATTDRPRTTPSAARPPWAARSSSAPSLVAYVAAHLVTLQPPTVSGAARPVPHDRAGARRLPRRLHQDLQAAQPRACARRRSWSGRRSSASSSRSSRCSSRNEPVPHARLAVHLVRPRHAPRPGLRRHARRGHPVRHLGQHHRSPARPTG